MLGFLKGRPEHPRIGQIRQLHLFATLAPRELRVVEPLLHERKYLKDEVIFDEGEEGQALYIVLSGHVLICRPGDPQAARIAEIPPGALFGELALLEGAPRTAQARAADDCVVVALSRADFSGLVETHGGIASKIALQLARDLGRKLVARFLTLDMRPQ
ncbi:MAG: cyclic nucleotide-binding domain-containing protein [Burkholderiales bacterium]